MTIHDISYITSWTMKPFSKNDDIIGFSVILGLGKSLPYNHRDHQEPHLWLPTLGVGGSAGVAHAPPIVASQIGPGDRAIIQALVASLCYASPKNKK